MKHTRLFSAAILGCLALAPLQAVAQDKEHAVATFISGGPTGTWFPTATAISELVNEEYSGQPVSTIPGKGAIGNALAVGAGKAEFGLSYGPFLLAVYKGNNPVLEREGLSELRAVANVVPNTVQIVVAGDVPDTIFADAKDGAPLRIGVGAKGSSNLFGIEKILMEYGVDFDQVEEQGGFVMEGAQEGLLDAFLNRQIDVYTNTVGIGASDLQQALSARDSRLFAIPEDIREKMITNWGYVKFDIPAGTYPGQDADVPSLDLSTLVITNAGMDDEIVYNMVKKMAENKSRLESAYGGFANWEPEDMARGAPIPLHPGAEKYFREVGWIE
ncbi:MAG: TAXI family TRAP transporter solute-binding subunit [Rhodobacteraceae bacterium]|nr:TAXI family TRAP transporter solute-binding subunit [Paracoccaceae bacterium]